MSFVAAAVSELAPPACMPVLTQAGIYVELLALTHARDTTANCAALWLEVARELDDEFFGLDSRRVKGGSFALLCHALIGSSMLERALRQILRGMTLFLDDVNAELSIAGDEAAIALCSRMAEPWSRSFADDTFLTLVH